MYGIIYNCRSVQPFAAEIAMDVPVYTLPSNRDIHSSSFEAVGDTVFNVGWIPTHIDWVEVYVDGFRIVNQSTDFGVTNDKYEIDGSTITFYEPVTGTVEIVCDKQTCPPFDTIQMISIDNEQGANVVSKLPAGSLYASLYCEPIALMQPAHGFVRMSDDRESLIYYPEQNYTGGDAFSYLVRTSRGQLSEPKCVNVFVGERPTPPEEEEAPE